MNTTYSTYEVRKRAVKAVLKGHSVGGVADTYDVHRSTLHRWVSRYQESGSFEGLARRPGSGRPGILDGKRLERLYRIVIRPATEFGYETDFWTCRRLIQVVRKELGVKVSQPTMWRMLRDCQLTYQKPERQYQEADQGKRRAWITRTIPKIRQTVKLYRAILYCEDESNVSLTSVLGKTWAPKGQTPKQSVTGKRGGVAAMSAITPGGSLVFTLHEKRIASAEVIRFLGQLRNITLAATWWSSWIKRPHTLQRKRKRSLPSRSDFTYSTCRLIHRTSILMNRYGTI